MELVLTAVLLLFGFSGCLFGDHIASSHLWLRRRRCHGFAWKLCLRARLGFVSAMPRPISGGSTRRQSTAALSDDGALETPLLFHAYVLTLRGLGWSFALLLARSTGPQLFQLRVRMRGVVTQKLWR